MRTLKALVLGACTLLAVAPAVAGEYLPESIPRQVAGPPVTVAASRTRGAVLQTTCTKSVAPSPTASGRQFPTYEVLYDRGSKEFIVNTYEKLIHYRVLGVEVRDNVVLVTGVTPFNTGFTVSFPNPEAPGEHPDPTSFVSASGRGVVTDQCGLDAD